MRVAWQRSSVVEQRNHNPLVGGPNPSAATKFWPVFRLFYFVLFARIYAILRFLADVFTCAGHNRGHRNTARMGGGDYRVFCFSLLNADRISVAL